MKLGNVKTMETLSVSDFKIVEGKLHLARPGFYAVLFMIGNEMNSINVKEILDTLSIDRLHFASIDISDNHNRDVVTLSRDTKAPIYGIPYLAFFVDGCIRSRYVGHVSTSAFTKYFTDKVSEAIKDEESFARN